MKNTSNISTISTCISTKNAVFNQTTLEQTIRQSLLFSDEIIIANSNSSSDGTQNLLKDLKNEYPGIIKIYTYEEKYKNFQINLADRKTFALKHCTMDYCILQDDDECIHEKYAEQIKKLPELYPDALAFRFKVLHFYRSYKHYHSGDGWYPKKIYMVKNLQEINHGRVGTDPDNHVITIPVKNSENSVRTVPLDSLSNNVIDTDITVYHYGWVRNDAVLLMKKYDQEIRWWGKKYWERHEFPFKFDDPENLPEFEDTHPRYMLPLIEKENKYNSMHINEYTKEDTCNSMHINEHIKEDAEKIISKNNRDENMEKIAFCQATFERDMELTKECIRAVYSYVDCVIISYDQTLTNEQIKWLEDNKEKYGLKLVRYEFIDDLPEMRNSYLDRAKELGMDWICVSDPDELYSNDLCRGLRELIETYSFKGYNMIGVSCQDEFINESWLDDLDRIKESPGGKGTNFWKPILILQISDNRSDIRYEGIGKEKRAHETVISSGPVKSINLDKKFFYTHKKDALRIWRNASRNLFIGGGGDNVGDENTLWVRLRSITNELGIDDWISFEKFVEKGMDQWLKEKIEEIKSSSLLTDNRKEESIESLKNLIQLFEQWLICALQAGTNNWQTETRETAKWYFALHHEEIDDFILGFIKSMPVTVEGSDSEIEKFVAMTYFEVLGRHPDHVGKSSYVHSIKSGKIKREDLAEVFKNSQEYKEKFVDNEMFDTVKDKKIDIKDREMVEKFVNDCYLSILERAVDKPGSRNYTENIMNGNMKPEELINILSNSDEYMQRFTNVDSINKYNIARDVNKGDKLSPFVEQTISYKKDSIMLGKRDVHLQDIDQIDSSKYNTVGLCIIGYSKAIQNILDSISIIGEAVNEIHVQGNDFGEENIRLLKDAGKKIGKDVEIHIVEWKDNFGDYKNKAVGHARTEWVLILDDNEIPTHEMALKLNDIVLKSDRGNNFDIVSFDIVDEISDNDDAEKLIYHNRNKVRKQLLHWNIPSPYTGSPYVLLKQSYYPWKTIYSGVAYRHVKT